MKLFVTCGKRIGIAMSKIGKKPIIISSAKVEIKDNLVSLSGAKGKLTHQCPDCLLVKLDDGKLVVSLVRATCKNNMLWGLHRALLANKVKGVEIARMFNVSKHVISKIKNGKTCVNIIDR